MMFKIGVFGIITDDQGRVLLCHRRDHNLWNLPGGAVEEGESPWDALVREVKEETGLDATPVHLTGIYNKPDKHEIVLSFACQITGGEITLTDEADNIQYFKTGQLPKNTAPKQVERIRDFIADQSKTHFKNQLGPSSVDLIKEGKS